MRSILHKLILAPAVMAAAALATNTAQAEKPINVPFNFTAAGESLPAGLYVVAKDNSSNLVTLRSTETAQSFTWIVGPGDPNPTDNQVVLRFDAAGQTHALRSIQYGSAITGRLDKKSIGAEEIGSGRSHGR
jgi:hypothetical protein